MEDVTQWMRACPINFFNERSRFRKKNATKTVDRLRCSKITGLRKLQQSLRPYFLKQSIKLVKFCHFECFKLARLYF